MATSYSGRIEYFKPITISETSVRLDYTCVPSLPTDGSVWINAFYKKTSSSVYTKIEKINEQGNIISGLEPKTSYDFYIETTGNKFPIYSNEISKSGVFTLADKIYAVVEKTEEGDNPSIKGWYEKDSTGYYFASTDTKVDTTKTYYYISVMDGVWDEEGTYTFTYSNSLWNVSFIPNNDFIVSDTTTYTFKAGYYDENNNFVPFENYKDKDFKYGPQRYYSISTVPPSVPEVEDGEIPASENYNNNFISLIPADLEAGCTPAIEFYLFNNKYRTTKTFTLKGVEITSQIATGDVETITTWYYPEVTSINSFVIGEEITISIDNPHKREFYLTLYGNDGSIIGELEDTTSETEISGFNSNEELALQRNSLKSGSGYKDYGKYYARLTLKNSEGTVYYTYNSSKETYWYTSKSINPPIFTSDNITYYDYDNGEIGEGDEKETIGNQKQIVNTITFDNQIIVQNQSYLVIKVAAAEARGYNKEGNKNKIKKYIATFNNETQVIDITGSNKNDKYFYFYFGKVDVNHSQYAYISAIDEFNQAVSASKKIVVRAYKDPYVDMIAIRVEEGSDEAYFKVVPTRSTVYVKNNSVNADVNEKPFSVKYTYFEKGTTTLDEIIENEITDDAGFKRIDKSNYSKFILNRLDYTKKWVYVVKVEDAFHRDFRLAKKANNAIYSIYSLQNEVYKKEVPVDEDNYITEKIKRNIDNNFVCPKFRISVLYPDETINYEIPSEDIKVGGQYSENYQNGQRRTLNFELNNEEGKYTPSINKFWAGTRLRLDVGVEYDTDQYYWFEKGVFVITSVQPSTVPGSKTVKVNAGDKYALFENNTGKLISAYEIDVDNDIEELIHEILFTNSGNGFPLDGRDFIYHSSFKGAKTQVKISKSAGDSYSSILSDIATQLSAEMFYDDHGRLNVIPLEEVTQDISKELLYNYDTEYSGISSLDFNLDYTSIVNRIIVTSSPSSGGVYYAEAVNDDAASPLSYQRIGYRTGDIINDNDIWSDNLAQERADYELRKVLILKSSTSVTVPFNPFLKVNNVISLSDEFYGLKRTRFLLQSVSYNLDYSNQMSISFSNLNNLPFIVR